MTDIIRGGAPPLPTDEESLRREVRALRRQVVSLQRLVDRSIVASQAKSNINSLITAEKSKQEQYMNLLLANCPDIILLLDEAGRFVYCTDIFLRRSGIANFGLINGRDIKDVFAQFSPGSWVERVDAVLRLAMREKRTITIDESANWMSDGRMRHYTISFTPMLSDGGDVQAAIVVFHNTTELVDAMEQAERAKEAAVQASTAKSDFLANMSHEMRTPLNAIIGMTSIAKASGELDKKNYCLDKVEDASTHLLGVINDILDMSKIEANKFELSPAPFVFERMLIRVNNVFDYRMDEKQLTFNIWVDSKIPRRILADEQRLSQVITNLLANAVKFTPEGGHIALRVKLESEDDGACMLRVEVEDNGIGISEEQQKRLFRSFEQADGSISRRFGGTGLGLAISKSIVQMMEGRIWVESELGKGSTFSFTVRAEKDLSPEAGSPRQEQPVVWETLRVLAVDDAPEVLEYFQSIAESIGFPCDVAAGGEEACRMIDSQPDTPYSVIFVDWNMPKMDGIALTREIRTRQGADAVVIMISATEWNRIERDAKAAGVDGFLPKPLFASLVEECIVECLGMKRCKDDTIAQPKEHTFEGVHVLMAEDVEINREIVLALLEPEGVVIDCAENGQVAYDMFAAQPGRYDIIFMDIHMPEVDGYEATRMIRGLEEPWAKEVPIIAMTANVFREDVERCLAAGMNDHVGKPLDMAEVLRKMALCLQGR